MGAGGSAKSVAGALAGAGIRGLFIANRTSVNASRLAKILRQKYNQLDIQVIALKDAPKYVPRSEWIIQTTSLGLHKGEKAPLSLQGARSTTWVVDLIYHRQTDFLKQAQQLGLRSINGLEMLLYQGALSFECWTGQKAPLAVMRQALIKKLKLNDNQESFR